MKKPLVTKTVDELWNYEEDYRALQRIIQNEYLDDEWEDDENDSIRALYIFLCKDIEASVQDSLIEEKIFMIRIMCNDLLLYRKAFIANKEGIKLNTDEEPGDN